MSNDHGRKLRVVLVDDSDYILEFVHIVLKSHPRLEIVATGHSGEQAVTLTETHRPDILVLDIELPGLSGIEVATRLGQRFPQLCIVILTSHEDPTYIREALRAGAADFLTKKGDDFLRVGEALITAHDRYSRRWAPRRASLWAFYGPRASAGTTTMAVNTACYLSTLSYRVLLIDLDWLQGDCGFYLDMAPGARNLFRELASGASFSPGDLSLYLRSYQPKAGNGLRLDLLDSPGAEIERTGDFHNNLDKVLNGLATEYDYVIVDLAPGRIWEDEVAMVLERSDSCFLVSHRDLVSIKALTALVRMFKRSDFRIDKGRVLLSSLLPAAGSAVGEILAREGLAADHIFEIPRDALTVSRAIRKGVPTIAENEASVLSTFVRTVTDTTLGRA